MNRHSPDQSDCEKGIAHDVRLRFLKVRTNYEVELSGVNVQSSNAYVQIILLLILS